MHLRRRPRPLRGALLLLLGTGLCAGAGLARASGPAGTAAAPVGQIATTFEQLRVNAVGDQLIGYLQTAVDWASRPGTRVPLASIKPGIREAVLAHPEVLLAQEQRQTAAAATREALAGMLPQVSSRLETGSRNFDAVSTPWSRIPSYGDNSKAFSLSASQLLYDFGGVSGKTAARTSLETAAAARAASKRSELSLRAASAWLELFRAQQMVRLTQMNTLSRQQVLSFIEEREQLGGSSQSDVLRVKARLADAEAAAVAAQIRLAAAQAVYQEMFSAPPPAQIALPEAVALDPARLSGPQDFGANPLLAEARAQTEAADREAKAAAAALLPSFHLELSARRRDMGGAGVPGTDWTAGVGVRHNLYAGGAELARQRQAEQRATEARLAQDNLRRQIERAGAQALADVNNSTAALSSRQQAVQVAALALEAVREQFSFRRGTLLDLLRSQEELYIAGRELVDGIVDHSLARFRLLHLSDELTPVFDLSGPPPASRD